MWIEAVVLEHRGRCVGDGRMAVLNFGGLHSPTRASGNPQYLSLVARPAIQALEDAGYERIEVCGNVTEGDLGEPPLSSDTHVEVGRRPHHEFEKLLSSAGLLLTSPGLTTLLEASAIGVPTLCLPPQNLSQVFNGNRFASAFGGEHRVAWGSGVLDLVGLEDVRLAGEEAALRFIDSSLSAQDPGLIYSSLYKSISEGIRAAGVERDWRVFAEHAGRRGAEQVAALVHQLVNSGTISGDTLGSIDSNYGRTGTSESDAL
jgi:hydroxymethylcytosylglucuronate/cytosylglucuronate synthase